MELLYYFARSKKDKQYGTIKLSVVIPGQIESVYSTGIQIDRKLWGGNLRRFVEKTDWAKRRNTELRQIESDVEVVRDLLVMAGYELMPALITKAYRNLASSNLPLTLDNITEALGDSARPDLQLIEAIDWLIKHKQKDIKDESTGDTYRARRKNFVNWVQSIKRPKFLASDFNVEKALLFCDWLRCQPNGKGGLMSQNHVARHIIFIKEAIEKTVGRGLVRQDQISKFVYSRKEVKDLRHFNPDEVDLLYKLDIESCFADQQLAEKVIIVRDLFIFCCYTGFHYVDRNGLSGNNIKIRNGSPWIYKQRGKTGIMAKQKIHPVALDIIDKYGGVDYLPKVNKNDNNDWLKLLESAAGLKIGLSTKIARKTFAYMCLNVWHIDKDTVAVMMGLKSPRHISDYAEIDENRIEHAINW
ncbi:site-specific integrase [Tellurirhabdus bombi]|uniref:hypothetical protein n=1 Tax=Tellurirhabdus bombi TaxID=2907205 RepID=UPI001F3BDB64|nr:hypothetical protein [Tellurirhabdus bombi]